MDNQKVETNGCDDGPTSLVVQNHTDSGQPEKKLPECHTNKRSAHNQEGRTTRHGGSGGSLNSRSRKKSPIVGGSPSSPASERRITRHSPSLATPNQNSKVTPRGRKAASQTNSKQTTPNNQQTTHNSQMPSSPAEDSASKTPRASTSHNVPSTERRMRKRQSSPVSDCGNVRTSKRVKLQYQPFQSPTPITSIPAILRHHQAPKLPDDKIVVFQKGEFLAVRNATDSFYVCRTAQNVYKSSKKFKIQWLDNDSETDIYAPDFYDTTDFECVLTNLRMRKVDKNRYLLPDEERKRTLNILQRALNYENGMAIPDPRQLTMDGVDVSFVGKEEEEKLSDSSPVAYFQKGPRVRNRKIKKEEESEEEEEEEEEADDADNKSIQSSDSGKTRRKPKIITTRGKNKAKVKLKIKKVKDTDHERKKSKVSSHGKIEKLHPNPKVTLFEKEPLFETNMEIPYVSSLAHSKLLIRAVLLKDYNLMQSLLGEKDKICTVSISRSIDVSHSALDYAVMKEDHRAIKMLLGADVKKLASPPTNMLHYQESGRMNVYMLGHAVRPVLASRGGREGNNAFLKDSNEYYQNYSPYTTSLALEVAVKSGVSLETIKLLTGSDGSTGYRQRPELYDNIIHAVRNGHCKLAGRLVLDAEKHGGFGFNFLHKEVLLNTKQPLSKFRSVSVLKKALDNGRVTPVHCAAINPNHRYLAELLSSVPNLEIPDKYGWRPAHFAAACEGTGPLELLLARGAFVHEVDTDGNTPLHIACQTGRAHNVELLLKHASGKKLENVASEVADKFGIGGMERPNKKTHTPLHLAIVNHHLKVVRVLLRFKVDIEKTLSTAYDKLTPLMLGAQNGDLKIVKLLVDNGARVEATDKKNRTALTHAVINGSSHVAAYLLHLGANPNSVDSSGNTLVHYAVAYGWYFCLKVLIEAGATPNLANDWKITPLAVAFMKGHMGLVDFLLEQPGVDINVDVQSDTGMTLVMQSLRAKLNASVFGRLEFLIEKQKSDCSKVDFASNNALHHLVLADSEFREDQQRNDFRVEGLDPEDSQDPEQQVQELFEDKERQEHNDIVQKVAKLLLEHDCDPSIKNKEQESPFTLAVKKGCLSLVQIFINHGCQLSLDINPGGDTILHSLAEMAQDQDVDLLLKAILKPKEELENSSESSSPMDILRQMANVYNNRGYTPLLLALKTLVKIHKKSQKEQMRSFIKFLLDDLGSDAAAVVKGTEGETDGSSALHLAVECKGVEATELLLNHKPLLEAVDKKGRTPLMKAIQIKNCKAAEALVTAGANVNVDIQDDSITMKLLIYAAMNDVPGELIRLMVQRKVNVNCIHPTTKNNALHYVVSNRAFSDLVETCKVLIDAGIDVNAANAQQRTALHLAVNSHLGGADYSVALEEFLLQHGAKSDLKDIRGRIPLHYAFVKIGKPTENLPMDPIEVVTVLTSALNPALIDTQDNFGQTPLHCAGVRGATICSMYLCQRMKNIDIKDKNGNTPLGLAVLNGHEGCCLILLQKGANSTSDLIILPESKSVVWQWLYLQSRPQLPLRMPILQEAVKKSWQGILHLMLDQLESFGKNLNIAVEAALKTSSYNLALKLISKVKHGWTLYSDKQTMLHLLAREAPSDRLESLQIKVAQALIDKGVPVMARDEHGCSVLTYAAMNWNHTLCEFFSDKMGMVAAACADPDKSLRTPFSAVFWKLNENDLPEAIKNWCLSLLKAGASADLLTCYPLRNLEFPGTICLSEECFHVENAAAARLSPLILAVCKKNYAVVKMLLKLEVNVNYADGQQRTALMYACRLNDVKMAKLLLNPDYDPDKDEDPFGDVRKTGFEHKSEINLAHQDMFGWTVVHHVVAPLPDITYASTSMLFLLAHIGAPLNVPDHNGITPLHLAAARGVETITLALQNLLGVPHDQQPKIAVHTLPPAEDHIKWKWDARDYRDDCRSLLSRLEEEEKATEASDNQQLEPEPDPLADMGSNCEIVVDKTVNIPYDILMTSVDLGYGKFGLYSFYKMQLLHHVGKDLIVLFTRWGRVGDTGQFQKTPFSSLQEGAKEFCKIFKAKTGNNWEDIQTFKPQPKKYRPVHLEKRRPSKRKEMKINLSSACPSSLPDPLQNLMKNLTDVQMLLKSPYSMGLHEDVPMGRLSEDTLRTALALLEDIRQLQMEKQKLQVDVQAQDKLAELMLRIVEKSEEYYYLIPVHGHQFERLEPLFEEQDLNNQLKLIHHLLNLEVAGELLLGAQSKAKEISPLDYVYRCLGCKLQLLDEKSAEAQIILQYIYNSTDSMPTVEGIYRVTREGEEQKLRACELRNHTLLWHGTRAANLLGILAQGLQVQPLGAVWSGDLFGKGIYLADRFQKSRKYCIADYENHRTRFILLCEAALGQVKEVELNTAENDNLTGGCESLKGLGRWQPHPLGTVSWHSCNVPLGPTNKEDPQHCCLNYNEYVVYKPAQVCLRYLIQYKD